MNLLVQVLVERTCSCSLLAFFLLNPQKFACFTFQIKWSCYFKVRCNKPIESSSSIVFPSKMVGNTPCFKETL